MITAIQTITQEELVSIQEFAYANYQATLLDIEFDRLSGRTSHEEYHAALESIEIAFNDSNLFLENADVIKESLFLPMKLDESLYGDDRLSFEVKEVNSNKVIASLTYESLEGDVHSTEAVAYRFSDGGYAIFSRGEYGSLTFYQLVSADSLEAELERYTSHLFDNLVSRVDDLSHLVNDFSFHSSFLPF